MINNNSMTNDFIKICGGKNNKCIKNATNILVSIKTTI